MQQLHPSRWLCVSVGFVLSCISISSMRRSACPCAYNTCFIPLCDITAFSDEHISWGAAKNQPDAAFPLPRRFCVIDKSYFPERQHWMKSNHCVQFAGKTEKILATNASIQKIGDLLASKWKYECNKNQWHGWGGLLRSSPLQCSSFWLVICGDGCWSPAGLAETLLIVCAAASEDVWWGKRWREVKLWMSIKWS